jgi:hypothetical protein
MEENDVEALEEYISSLGEEKDKNLSLIRSFIKGNFIKKGDIRFDKEEKRKVVSVAGLKKLKNGLISLDNKKQTRKTRAPSSPPKLTDDIVRELKRGILCSRENASKEVDSKQFVGSQCR